MLTGGDVDCNAAQPMLIGCLHCFDIVVKHMSPDCGVICAKAGFHYIMRSCAKMLCLTVAVWLRSGKKLSDISWFMYGMTIFLFFIAAGNTLNTWLQHNYSSPVHNSALVS